MTNSTIKLSREAMDEIWHSLLKLEWTTKSTLVPEDTKKEFYELGYCTGLLGCSWEVDNG